jgi:SAM-dependent methyltransferase
MVLQAGVAMQEIRVSFDDADAYERYMGRWSRAVGDKFLAWLELPKHARWLDVGCGSGAFCELVVGRCAPSALSGIDPSPAQVEFARRRLPQADIRVADSMDLPFREGEFDVVASALVLHFIPDRAKAFAEMKRVTRREGMVAGYTWERSPVSDFAPYAPMLEGLKSIGVEPMRSPTVPEQRLDGLRATAEAASLRELALTQIEVRQRFRDFDEYWDVQTLPVSPVGRTVAGLSDEQRVRLRETMRAALPIAEDGSITYPARAVAFKARA